MMGNQEEEKCLPVTSADREIPPVNESTHLLAGTRDQERDISRASHQGCDVPVCPSHQLWIQLCLLQQLLDLQSCCTAPMHPTPVEYGDDLPSALSGSLLPSEVLGSMMLCGGLQLVLSCTVFCVLCWKHSLVLIKALRTQVREKEEKMLRTANFLNCPLAPFETYLM